MDEPRYHLVEVRTPEAGWTELQLLAAQARSAADEVRSEGSAVRFLRSICVPESDRCFLLFEAPSPAEAGLAAARADLLVTSVVAAPPPSPPNGGQTC